MGDQDEDRFPTLSEICKDLDKTVIEYFKILDDILKTRHELETLMKDGYFFMSKARYSMGVKSISPLQYDEDSMQASVHVDVHTEKSKKTRDHITMSLSQEHSLPNGASNTSDNSENNLRKRRGKAEDKGDGVESITEGVQDIEIKKNETKSKLKKDPIKWFGILVPTALKESQKKFKQSMELITTLTTLQNELLVARDRYKEISKQKFDIVGYTGDDNMSIGQSSLESGSPPSSPEP